MEKQSRDWQPIGDFEPEAGCLQVYEFEALNNGRTTLSRTFQFQRNYGRRVCVRAINVPLPTPIDGEET